MIRKVTLTFTLDTDAYDDPGDNDTPEACRELVRAMLREEADWPWECESNNSLTITIE